MRASSYKSILVAFSLLSAPSMTLGADWALAAGAELRDYDVLVESISVVPIQAGGRAVALKIEGRAPDKGWFGKDISEVVHGVTLWQPERGIGLYSGLVQDGDKILSERQVVVGSVNALGKFSFAQTWQASIIYNEFRPSWISQVIHAISGEDLGPESGVFINLSPK